MLPFCYRTVSVPRTDVAPVWTRSFPISKEATTLGQHLRKKRFNAGMRQTEAAQRLGVSDRTLSLWECDRLQPKQIYWPAIRAYLGFDPFASATNENVKGNET